MDLNAIDYTVLKYIFLFFWYLTLAFFIFTIAIKFIKNIINTILGK